MEFKVRKLSIKSKEDAIRELNLTGADEAGVARMADKCRFYALKAERLKVAAGNIIKQEALSVGCDCAVARGVINCAVPTTDVVIMGTVKQLKKLSQKLKAQPFGLKRLADEILAVIRPDLAPVFEWNGGSLDLSRPNVMGIINVTPDSFSDGGRNFNVATAVDNALRMIDEGADILDIGGESTRPGAAEVSAQDELSRVIPVIEGILKVRSVPISIDTYKAGVAKAALDAGAVVVNDISGLTLDADMAGVVAASGAGLVVMHMRGTPRTMQTDTAYADIVGEIFGLLDHSVQTALKAGVAANRIAVDPGIGFGKTAEGNLALLNRLDEFGGLGRPVLLGASRKSFIGKALKTDDPKDRVEGSLAAAVIGLLKGAHIFRVHDVRETRRALDLAHAVTRESL